MTDAADRWWRAGALHVHYEPKIADVRPGDLLVGIGSAELTARADLVMLNHKLLPRGERRRSLSDQVAGASPETAGAWRRCFPRGMADVARVVVEDASLDTCMALLLFARAVSPRPVDDAASLGAIQSRCTGVGAPREAAWREYVADWEEGRYVDGDDKRRSVACLMAVLAHCLLPPAATGQSPAADASAKEALVQCLSLLDAYLEYNERPQLARAPLHEPAYTLADAQFEYEYQQYLLALKHGIQTQLRVPLSGSSRSLLVDALLFTDIELTGSLKLLARTDTERSWTRRGFALIGVYRPSLAASEGGHITLSVDPEKGLTLEALWHRLEALEDERWGGARPTHRPRRGILAYTDPVTGEPKPGAPHEPWWDQHGTYTLLSAPRPIEGQPGTRLDWSGDVLPLLWQLYRPFPALASECLADAAGGLVSVVHWRRGIDAHAEAADAAGRTRVLHQWLASCSAPGTARHPGEFVSYRDLEIASLPGGDIVAHSQGVTLFDDWTRSDLPTGPLSRVASSLAEITADYRELLGGYELAELGRLQRHAIERLDRIGYRRFHELRLRVLRLKTRLADLSSREAALPAVRGGAELRQALEKAWGLPQMRHELRAMVDSIDSMLVDAHALLDDRRSYRTTAILSAAAMFVVLRDALAVLASWSTMNPFEVALPHLQKLIADAGSQGLTPSAREALLVSLTKARDDAMRSAELASAFDTVNLVLLASVVLACLYLGARRYVGDSFPPRSPRARADGTTGTPDERAPPHLVR